MESKIRVLVADTEVEYSATLVRFLSGKHGAQFTVALVNNPEKRMEFATHGARQRHSSAFRSEFAEILSDHLQV